VSHRKAVIAFGALVIIVFTSVARSQTTGALYRLGFLSSFAPEEGKELVGCFRKGLDELGWREGRNVRIEYRWAGGRADKYLPLASELASLKLDLLVSNSTPATQALHRVVKDVPIVFISVSDPVASGIVKTLGRPGANITGVSNSLPESTIKLLELAKSFIPTVVHVVVMRDPANEGKALEVKALQSNAAKLGLDIDVIDVRNSAEIGAAFSTMGHIGRTALVVLTDGVTISNRDKIVALARNAGLPAFYQTAKFVDLGGLMSYGPNFCQHFQHAAAYVDKILKGAKAADLPVELPTTFELVVNLHAAKALGLNVPQSVLLRADRVIE
jgi:putative ABC transport system substrate-binding protein